MREITGNIFDYAGPGNVIVIPTNGNVTAYGKAVMGKGVALQAKQRWPKLPTDLGKILKREGNRIAHFGYQSENGFERVVTFPTKENWPEDSTLALIEKNTVALANYCAGIGNDLSFYLPRLGCGEGGLQWEAVKPVLAKLLDDRFVVVSLKANDKG